jgi:hypothetical protein
MEAQFINFLIMDGNYTIIGTYKVAHSTSHAGMDRVCTLVDTMVNTEKIAWFFLQTYGNLNGPLPVDTQLYCTNRADRRTPATEGAFILVPEDYPWQIFCA